MPSRAVMSFERRRHVEGMRAALQRARPRDQRERQLVAEAHLADGDDGIGLGGHRRHRGDHEGQAGRVNRSYFTAENAVGRRNELLILAMIGPIVSLVGSRAFARPDRS